VLGDIEAGIIHPERSPQPEGRPVEHLTQPRRRVEASFDLGSHDTQPELTVRVAQGRSVEDGEGGDVHR
jgi:hypothetical protein